MTQREQARRAVRISRDSRSPVVNPESPYIVRPTEAELDALRAELDQRFHHLLGDEHS